MILFLKRWLKKLPFNLTKNQRYDRLTKQIIASYCKDGHNCIDVGTHRGEVLDHFIKHSPNGKHFGFEPLPGLFRLLEKKYASSQCKIYPLALSNRKGDTSFNYVLSNPAYSGIRKRKYDRKNEQDLNITVESDTLDNVIPTGLAIHFMKIDVEGGEMDVMEGGRRILAEHKPMIIFEFGIGGSDIYGVTPEKMYSFLSGFGYRIYLLDAFIDGQGDLTEEGFNDQFYKKKNYYFIAA